MNEQVKGENRRICYIFVQMTLFATLWRSLKKSKEKKIKPKKAYSSEQSEDRTQKKDRSKQGRIDIEA